VVSEKYESSGTVSLRKVGRKGKEGREGRKEGWMEEEERGRKEGDEGKEGRKEGREGTSLLTD
jgi:hypothetical protein